MSWLTDAYPLRVCTARTRRRSPAEAATSPLVEQVGPLAGEECGVFRQDAILGREADDLLDELPVGGDGVPPRRERGDRTVGTPGPDGVHQEADLPAGPEPGDEAVARRRPIEREPEPQTAVCPTVVAAQGEVE